MAQIHPFCQQKEIVEYCGKHGIVVEAYTPLIRGRWNDTIVNIGKKVRRSTALTTYTSNSHAAVQQGPRADISALVSAARVSRSVSLRWKLP